MQLCYILFFCVQQVILKVDFAGSNGTLEANSKEISNKSVYNSILPVYDRIITHRIPNLDVSEMVQQSADLGALTTLVHTFNKEFDSLEKIIKPEWTDLREIEAVTTGGLSQTMGDIKTIDEQWSLDYLIRRIIQKLEQSVENIIETIPPIVQMRNVNPNGLKFVYLGNNSFDIYQEWLNGVDSDLAYLCNEYAYGDEKKKEEIKAQLARIVKLLEKLSNQNRMSASMEKIHSLDIVVSTLIESISSGALINKARTDLSNVNTFTTNDGQDTPQFVAISNSSFRLMDGNRELEFFYDIITDFEELLKDNQGPQTTTNDRWAGFEMKIKSDQILNLIKVIGLQNIPEEIRRRLRRLQEIANELEKNNNNENGNGNSAEINDISSYFRRLEEEQILENNYISLSKRYLQINSLINFVMKQLFEPDVAEKLEIELMTVLTNVTALQGDVIRTIEQLPDSEKHVHEDSKRNEMLNDQMKKIEEDIDELSRIVNSHGMPYILDGIRDKTMSVLEKLDIISLNYLPEDILSKIYHVNIYLISLVASAREFDKNTREENDTLHNQVNQLNDHIAEIDDEFRQTQLDFNEGKKDVNTLRIQASNIFIRISKLRMLDYLTDDLLNKLVRLEDDTLTFITKMTSSKETQSGTTHIYHRETSLETNITNYQNILRELKQKTTEHTNWYSLQKILFEIESIEYKLTLQKKLTTLQNNHHILIEKIFEDINKFKKEVLSKIEVQENSDSSCKPTAHSEQDSLVKELVNYFETRFAEIKVNVTNNSLDWKSLQKINLEIQTITDHLNLNHKNNLLLSDELRTRIDSLLRAVDAFKNNLELTVKDDVNTSPRDVTLVTHSVNNFEIQFTELQQHIISHKEDWMHLKQVTFELDTIIQRTNILKEKVKLSGELLDRVQKFLDNVLNFKTEINNIIQAIETADSKYIENVEKKREDLVVQKIGYFETLLKQFKTSLRNRVRDWFFITRLDYRTEKLIYELKILQVTRPLSGKSKDRIKTLLEDAAAFKSEVELIIKEQDKTMENTRKCDYDAYSYNYSTREELKKILSSLREIIKDTSERTLTQMTSIEESLSNFILNTHSVIESTRMNTSIEHTHNYASFINSPDIVLLNITEVVNTFEERIELIKDQILPRNPYRHLESLLAESWNIFELLEIFQRLDASDSSKSKLKLVKEEVKIVIDEIESQIEQDKEVIEPKILSADNNDAVYSEILAALKKNITEYEKEYYHIRGFSLSVDNDAAFIPAVKKLEEAASRLEDLSDIDASKQVKTQVNSLAVRVKTILQSEAYRKHRHSSLF